MRAIVIGCGRVGATLARTLDEEGWEVTVVELDEDNLSRLGPEWRQPLVLGHGMDAKVLEEAGVEDADVLIAATDGDNTNLVIAQVAIRKYGVAHVAARIQDPARAEAYAGRGFHILAPVKMAIEGLASWALAAGSR
jgi:trk system potassium uptake protein TrkA